mmetsp:Transcript_712/g.835  ORF Transcript_712/g.835 Transcript_712/m.835 type:complete len:231 (+) Transcript_712:112-804(+)|eukprot:CAMPEP_0205805728 /NCGR_PEP_ID=MMETSP0205-20121125/9048_1 /ASSEMBLY_ACC=CAM_ASM_000278 /TAXON_ID=36767 /ORGANISM="Euplotes focardii, Strain TN1" /LENGTH=230 /DNA_ID=CAMNT_0053077429 /DNA_START=101 /DNA_END=793 /DNA_ORIENTATION=+
MDEINFPESTPARIVIKSNEKGTGFMRNHYHDEFCRNYITKKDFDIVVDKVSLIIGNEYSRKRKLDTKGMDMCTKVLMLVALLQLLLFFLFAMIFVETGTDGYKYVTIANAFIGFSIALSIMFYNYFRPYEENSTFEQMVFRKVNEHLIFINEDFRSQNLEWLLIPNHYWMELRILDKNEKDFDAPINGPGRSRFQNHNSLQDESEDNKPHQSKSEEDNSKLFEEDEEDE